MITMKLEQQGLVKIGTSGVVLPGNKTSFPPEFQTGTRLHYYGALFNSLEINSSFYKIPKQSTFEKWASEVPENFSFTTKLWRGITHVKNLEYSQNDIASFMNAADGLGDKKGCLLVQFPASIRIDLLNKVEEILQEIVQFNQHKQWQLAIEFRHKSWYHKDVYKILAKYQASLVLHDMPNSTSLVTEVMVEAINASHIYLRFHGPTGQYNGSYSNQFIDDYAERIKEWRAENKVIYVYFNNTIGSALQNAQRLQQQIT